MYFLCFYNVTESEQSTFCTIYVFLERRVGDLGGWVAVWAVGWVKDGELPIFDTDATLESNYGGQST